MSRSIQSRGNSARRSTHSNTRKGGPETRRLIITARGHSHSAPRVIGLPLSSRSLSSREFDGGTARGGMKGRPRFRDISLLLLGIRLPNDCSWSACGFCGTRLPEVLLPESRS